MVKSIGRIALATALVLVALWLGFLHLLELGFSAYCVMPDHLVAQLACFLSPPTGYSIALKLSALVATALIISALGFSEARPIRRVFLVIAGAAGSAAGLLMFLVPVLKSDVQRAQSANNSYLTGISQFQKDMHEPGPTLLRYFPKAWIDSWRREALKTSFDSHNNAPPTLRWGFAESFVPGRGAATVICDAVDTVWVAQVGALGVLEKQKAASGTEGIAWETAYWWTACPLELDSAPPIEACALETAFKGILSFRVKPALSFVKSSDNGKVSTQGACRLVEGARFLCITSRRSVYLLEKGGALEYQSFDFKDAGRNPPSAVVTGISKQVVVPGQSEESLEFQVPPYTYVVRYNRNPAAPQASVAVLKDQSPVQEEPCLAYGVSK